MAEVARDQHFGAGAVLGSVRLAHAQLGGNLFEFLSVEVGAGDQRGVQLGDPLPVFDGAGLADQPVQHCAGPGLGLLVSLVP
jgi:hypothetical protein